jgi:hypothetical protein
MESTSLSTSKVAASAAKATMEGSISAVGWIIESERNLMVLIFGAVSISVEQLAR